jgi:serine/threonine protein kinase
MPDRSAWAPQDQASSSDATIPRQITVWRSATDGAGYLCVNGLQRAPIFARLQDGARGEADGMSMSNLPRAVGPLTLLRKLETDTVSDIFQGTLDTLEGRSVLVRRILPHVLRDTARLRAIEARAKDLMKIDDEVLQRTFHWVVDGTDRYLVEDLPPGVGLDSVITWCRFAERPLPPDVFLSIALQISEALEALHRYRAADGTVLLHMGLSPSSVTLRQGANATVGLYALARAPAAVPAEVSSATLNHRSQYLSPEQTHPDQVLEPTSDVYSAAAILYELLMLEPLSSGETSVQTVHQIRRGDHARQLQAAAARVPALDAVLARALATDPRARYATAAALSGDLRVLLGGGRGDAHEVDRFLEPLLASIERGPRAPQGLEVDRDRTAGDDALVTWSTMSGGHVPPPQDDDDDTLVRERPPDPAGYSVEFAGALDPTDARDPFEDPTGEVVVDPTTYDGEAADTQFYRLPASSPPSQRIPEPMPVAALSPPPADPPPLWAEDEPQVRRSGVWIAGSVGGLLALAICAGLGVGAAKLLTERKTEPPPQVAVEKAPPPTPAVAPTPVEEPIVPPTADPEPPPVAEVESPPVRATERSVPAVAEPAHERVVAEVEPPSPPEERTPRIAERAPPVAERAPPVEEPEPPVVERAPPVVERAPPVAERAPPVEEPEPAISDEDLFADLSTSRRPSTDDLLPTETDLAPEEPTPISRTNIDLDGMKPSARQGELTNGDVLALEGVTTADPSYTRSRALLLMNAEKTKDLKATKRYLDDLMRLPENQYDPIFLTELARYYVGVGKYQQAVEKAKTAEQQWARLPSGLVYTKKAEMYEIQARAYTGIFFESESVDALDHAIRSWERYRTHVATRSNDELVAMADKELVKLRTYRDRME